MRKKLSAYFISLGCAVFLVAGCAGEKGSVKSEAAPVAEQEAPAAKESALIAAVPPEKPTTAAAITSPDDAVAKVGATTITSKELERAFSVLVAQNRIQPAATPEAVKEAKKAALEQLIFAELIYQQGMKTAPADLEKQVEFKMAQNKGKFGSPAEFEAALKDSGVTEKDLAEISRKDIVISNYIEKNIVPSITVTDAEIKKFYDENRAGLGEEPQVKASHILIGVDSSATADVKTKAKEKAEAILKELKAGKDFAAAAKADSTDSNSEQGGDLGFFGKGQMVPEFENAAFALKPGEISDVVETQFGYHIIKLIDRKKAEEISFSTARNKMENYLRAQKTNAAIEVLLVWRARTPKSTCLL